MTGRDGECMRVQDKDIIYLDYNATTPVDPQVLNKMLPFFMQKFGNPSSGHPIGKEAKGAVENARCQVASLLGCSSEEIIFTSGGTESNNLVLFGVTEALKGKGKHVITSRIEHSSVIEPCIELICRGFDVTFVDVDRNGKVDPDDIRSTIRPDTILISVMHANNEIGTVQPLKEIGRIAKEKGILFHTDAAQSAGKAETLVDELLVDFLTIAGHKLYAPKGIGALYIRKGVPLKKIMYGAGQERGLRPGTENVAYIVGLGEAADIASKTLDEEIKRLRKLRDFLESRLLEGIPDAVVHARGAERLPNTLSIAFPGKKADEILPRLKRIAASPGAACHSGKVKVSHVMTALGVPDNIALGTLRLSVGRFSTAEEIADAADYMVNELRHL